MGLPSTIPVSTPQTYHLSYIELFRRHNNDIDAHNGRIRWLEETFQGTPRPAVDIYFHWVDEVSYASIRFNEYELNKHQLEIEFGYENINYFGIYYDGIPVEALALFKRDTAQIFKPFTLNNNLETYGNVTQIGIYPITEYVYTSALFVDINKLDNGNGITNEKSGIIIDRGTFPSVSVFFDENYEGLFFNEITRGLGFNPDLNKYFNVVSNDWYGELIYHYNVASTISERSITAGSSYKLVLNSIGDVFSFYFGSSDAPGDLITWRYVFRITDVGNLIIPGTLNFKSGEVGDFIKQPRILQPITNQTNVSTTPTLRADVYRVYDNIFYGLHDRTQWQISTDPDFNNIIYDVIVDTAPLDQHTVTTALNPNTTYYVRVRYGSDFHWSRWSEPVKFSTGVVLAPVIDKIIWVPQFNQFYGGSTVTATVSFSGTPSGIQYRIRSATCSILPVPPTPYQSSASFNITLPVVDTITECTIYFEVINSLGDNHVYAETIKIVPPTNKPFIYKLEFDSNRFYENSNYKLKIYASDPDGNPLTYRVYTTEPFINILPSSTTFVSTDTFIIQIPEYTQLNNPSNVTFYIEVSNRFVTVYDQITINVERFNVESININNFEIRDILPIENLIITGKDKDSKTVLSTLDYNYNEIKSLILENVDLKLLKAIDRNSFILLLSSRLSGKSLMLRSDYNLNFYNVVMFDTDDVYDFSEFNNLFYVVYKNNGFIGTVILNSQLNYVNAVKLSGIPDNLSNVKINFDGNDFYLVYVGVDESLYLIKINSLLNQVIFIKKFKLNKFLAAGNVTDVIIQDIFIHSGNVYVTITYQTDSLHTYTFLSVFDNSGVIIDQVGIFGNYTITDSPVILTDIFLNSDNQIMIMGNSITFGTFIFNYNTLDSKTISNGSLPYYISGGFDISQNMVFLPIHRYGLSSTSSHIVVDKAYLTSGNFTNSFGIIYNDNLYTLQSTNYLLPDISSITVNVINDIVTLSNYSLIRNLTTISPVVEIMV